MDNTPPHRNLPTRFLPPPYPNKRILFLEQAYAPLQQAVISQQASESQQQDGTSQASAPQQQDDVLQSFHPFSQLPAELQDQIWECALDMSATTAHYVDVESESDGCWKMRLLRIEKDCDVCMWRRGRESTEAIYPIRQALMQTCRRSYAFVKDVWGSRDTLLLEIGGSRRDVTECNCPVPVSWSAIPALQPPYYFLMNRGRSAPYIVRANRGVSSLPRTQSMKGVDISRDLMVFYYSLPNVFGNDGTPSDFKRGADTNVKQVAVPYSSTGFHHYRPALACMLGVLNELRTLYLLVDPSQVDIPPRTIAEGRLVPLGPPGPRNLQLREYLHRHRRTPADTSRKTFRLRDRIYYELPDETVLYLAPENVAFSFLAIEEVAREQREKNGGVPLPPLVVRFMSWKPTPRLRDRFETDPELLPAWPSLH